MISEHSSAGSHNPSQSAPAGLGSQARPGALHGRLLNVSRMATIGEMAAGVAHELNQPLTAIGNYAHACERLLSRQQSDVEDIDVETIREALRQITRQTTRAADILGRLRALARGQQAAHVPASVNALVAELQELVQSDAVLHGVELILDLAPDLPEVAVDSGQIQQAIMNLARNSLEALAGLRPAGAHIAIRTTLTAEGEVELSVTDNGPGVSAQAMKRIFDPFFSTKENGTGLGLAITHTIARAHGGSLGYRPNVPSGACFYMLLPTEPH